MTMNAVSRIGPKGQIVLRKSLREEAGFWEGAMVEEKVTKEGILIKLFDADKLLASINETAKKLSEKWPKGLTAAEAVRRERR